MPYPIYASDLTMFKCPRALYHCAVNRDKKPSYDEETIEKFDHYASLETVAFGSLKADGWNIIKPVDWKPGVKVPKDSQELFCYKDIEGNDAVRGRIDLVACPPGIEEGGLYEVKTASEHIFKQFDSIEDFIDSRYWWISGQLAQWAMYMYMSGKNYGGIVQLDRDSVRLSNGGFKASIKIHHCSILKGHQFYNERVANFMNKVVENIDTAWDGALLGLEPEYCKDLAVCANCWCNRTVCYPPIERKGIDMGFLGTHNPDDISRMLELAPLAKEYNGLKDKIEKPLKQGVKDYGAPEQGWIIGEGKYLAVAKLSKPRKVYDIPEDIKKKYETLGNPSVSIIIESLEPTGRNQ